MIVFKEPKSLLVAKMPTIFILPEEGTPWKSLGRTCGCWSPKPSNPEPVRYCAGLSQRRPASWEDFVEVGCSCWSTGERSFSGDLEVTTFDLVALPRPMHGSVTIPKARANSFT